MSVIYADPSDDFSLPKKAQARDEVDRDGNGYINCYNDLFLSPEMDQQPDDDEGELDFNSLMMLPSMGDDDDAF